MEKNSSINMPKEMMFSLDIGTRSCVGIISEKNEDSYDIVDYEIVEHPQRAMYDGQIHDIDMVVKVVKKIVSVLEERNNYKLKSVAIAAAGRSLKTCKIKVSRGIDDTREISKEIMDSLEMEGVQRAQEELLASEKISTKYYCVGYSIVNYYLDDGIIVNPKGHKGLKLELEIIATFLPHIVVDSLYTVMSKANLDVMNLTLEPIAAINIAIPQNLRLLNLALIDVGAGTSDIAITKNGTIVAYGMVSMAGDKITEFLAKEYLLDFREAEKLKVSLSKNDEVKFTDVIGIEHIESSDDVVDKVYPIIKEITNEIGKTIIELNEKSSSAVFCIGGGCQIPRFTECLAESLEIQSQRVVIKGTEMLENIKFFKEKLVGPEFITPIGIGYTAYSEKEKDFLQITVNDKPIRLFNSKQLTVSDSLILVGYNPRNLISARGEPLKFSANGIEKIFYGEYGESARIYVNGAISSLDTGIKNKDNIFVEQATSGKVKELVISDFLNLSKTVIYDGKNYNLICDVKVNGMDIKEDYLIQNGDIITFLEIDSLYKFSNHYAVELDNSFVNGNKVEKNYILKNEDVLENKFRENKFKELKFNLKKEEKKYNYVLYVNNDTVKISDSNKELVFVDIFDYIDFDLTVAKGIIDLKLNGSRASYSDKLNSGDTIEIQWR